MFHYMPRKLKELERRQDGTLILNAQNLKTICIIEQLYEYPDMNTKLYLMKKSISKIQNLEPYKNLKALYLENNLIKKIENLECLPQLQCLFLQNNMITVIQNLNLPNLKILNLSHNQLTKLEGLSQLVELQSLAVSHNFFKDYESIQHIRECSPTLTNVDLSANRIEGDQTLVELFVQLKCVSLVDNPFVRELKFYRRTMIGNLPLLTYLDQRGVDTEERILAEAWVKQGDEGLKKARQDIINHRKAKKSERSAQIMKDIDKHRHAKIAIFKGSIEDCKRQIQRMSTGMEDTTNVNQAYYENRVNELRAKINEYYDNIIQIEKRLGKVVTVRQLEFMPIAPAGQEAKDHSTEPRHSSGQTSVENSDNQSQKSKPEEQMPVFYDELD